MAAAEVDRDKMVNAAWRACNGLTSAPHATPTATACVSWALLAASARWGDSNCSGHAHWMHNG